MCPKKKKKKDLDRTVTIETKGVADVMNTLKRNKVTMCELHIARSTMHT